MRQLFKKVIFFLLRIDERLFTSRVLVPWMIEHRPLWFGSYLMAPRKRFERILIIIRLDALGDYILFRNSFEYIRKSDRFRDYKIVFLGNEIYRELAESIDRLYIDEFIWVNPKRFDSDRRYFLTMVYQLNKLKAGFLLNPHFSKTHSTELSKLYINAGYNITPKGDTVCISQSELIKYEAGYEELVVISQNLTFELTKNQEFIKVVLKDEKKHYPYNLELHPVDKNRPTYIVIFPGAGLAYREWSESNYAQLISELKKRFEFEIIINGSKDEYAKCQRIIETSGSLNGVFNYAGSKSLLEVTKLINEAALVIGNESAPIHIAAATKTPFICISNGNHFGRFNPYPNDIFDQCSYIYPSQIDQTNSDMLLQYIDLFRGQSNLDINEITVEEVVQEFDSIWTQLKVNN